MQVDSDAWYTLHPPFRPDGSPAPRRLDRAARAPAEAPRGARARSVGRVPGRWPFCKRQMSSVSGVFVGLGDCARVSPVIPRTRGVTAPPLHRDRGRALGAKEWRKRAFGLRTHGADRGRGGENKRGRGGGQMLSLSSSSHTPLLSNPQLLSSLTTLFLTHPSRSVRAALRVGGSCTRTLN